MFGFSLRAFHARGLMQRYRTTLVLNQFYSKIYIYFTLEHIFNIDLTVQRKELYYKYKQLRVTNLETLSFH